MSKKSQILSLLDEGKTYDEIQETVTGATRSYIRTVATGHRKDAKPNEIPSENPEPKEKPGIEDGSGGMEFENDIDDEKHNMTNDKKSGPEYHKAWVEAKAYECSCGCTLNRKSTYCPNCGVVLDWSGF